MDRLGERCGDVDRGRDRADAAGAQIVQQILLAAGEHAEAGKFLEQRGGEIPVAAAVLEAGDGVAEGALQAVDQRWRDPNRRQLWEVVEPQSRIGDTVDRGGEEVVEAVLARILVVER